MFADRAKIYIYEAEKVVMATFLSGVRNMFQTEALTVVTVGMVEVLFLKLIKD